MISIKKTTSNNVRQQSGSHIIAYMSPTPANKPKHLQLKKHRGLTITWTDGRVSFYPVDYLRRMSPSADTRELRKEMETNPLTVLPASAASNEPLEATGAQLVGNYAVRIAFSDGHDTGLYSWDYLREIDPGASWDPGEDEGL